MDSNFLGIKESRWCLLNTKLWSKLNKISHVKNFRECKTFYKRHHKTETDLVLSWRDNLEGNESRVWLPLETDCWQTDEGNDSNIGDIKKEMIWHSREMYRHKKWKAKVAEKDLEYHTWSFSLSFSEMVQYERGDNKHV